MEETVVVSADQQRFIEAIALHFEALGLPRIGGRVLGLLLVAPRPLALEEIADLLLVSRASVSTNTRQLIQIGLVAPHSQPGDRRNYYAFADDAWEHRLQLVRASAVSLQRLAAMGDRVAAGDAARERLARAGAFGEFLEAQTSQMIDTWRKRGDAR